MDIIQKRQATLLLTGIITCIVFLFCVANNPFICLVIVLSLLAVLTSLYFKEKVFFAFIFLYPLLPGYFAFDLGGAFPLVTISRMFVIYVILFDLIFNKEKFRKIKNIAIKRSEVKLLVFSIMFLLCAYLLNYFKYPDVESFKILISFLLEEMSLVVYIFFRAGSSKDVEKLIKCFLFTALFLALTGIIEFALQINLFSFLDIVKSDRRLFSSDAYARLGENRIEGPFGHPIAYCNFLLMAIPLGIYEWQKSKEIKVKTGYFVVIIVLLINFLFTLSRGPMLALIIGMLFYFVFTNKRSKQIIFMLIIIVVGLLTVGMIGKVLPWFVRNFLLSLWDSVFMKNSEGFGDNSNASEYRLYLFSLAKKLITDSYIWLGRGVSFFRINEVYDWVPGRSTTQQTRIVSIDNYYILKYIEMGLTGIISNLTFIFSLIYSCFVNFSKRINKEFYLCLLFIFISYFVSLFTADEIGTFRFIWIITGILTVKLSLNQVVK